MFFSTIHTFTPHSTVPISSSSPWLSQLLRRKIHKRRAFFHCATLSHNPHDWLCYRTCQNSIVKESRTAKSHFLNNLSLSPRSFWSFVRSLQKNRSSIPNLKNENSLCCSYLGKANLLNNGLYKLFTQDTSPPPPPPLPHHAPEDILCSTETVYNLIAQLLKNTSLDAMASSILYPPFYYIQSNNRVWYLSFNLETLNCDPNT